MLLPIIIIIVIIIIITIIQSITDRWIVIIENLSDTSVADKQFGEQSVTRDRHGYQPARSALVLWWSALPFLRFA